MRALTTFLPHPGCSVRRVPVSDLVEPHAMIICARAVPSSLRPAPDSLCLMSLFRLPFKEHIVYFEIHCRKVERDFELNFVALLVCILFG